METCHASVVAIARNLVSNVNHPWLGAFTRAVAASPTIAAAVAVGVPPDAGRDKDQIVGCYLFCLRLGFLALSGMSTAIPRDMDGA